ncbi:twik family of potassium channels protein 7 [Plakobranchus ocellatus]|uniref:Twik family of potassium channels protein 7 n=1 Tax=Plakobranchus ocellatus TaxID=259542 RepID=A0AAV3Y296_9GAST|nr:twik family of potassium channels protein 7 [Plakobranchus ocellatus]
MDAESPRLAAPVSPSLDERGKQKRGKKKSGSKAEAIPGKSKKDKPGKFTGKTPKKKAAADGDDAAGLEPSSVSSSSPDKHSRFEESEGITINDAFNDDGKKRGNIQALITDNEFAFEKSSTLPSPTSPGSDSVFEDSPFSSKREHSKSRSRSGSRNRFSGFFKRKKQRSRSETDLSCEVNTAVDDIPLESSTKSDRKRRAKSATRYVSEAVDTKYAVGATAQGASPRKANLKRESPHYAYDSRIQPRDRLLNMTVRDAAIEQIRQKRVDSVGTSPQRMQQGSEVNDSLTRHSYTYDTMSPSFSEDTLPASTTSGFTGEGRIGKGHQTTSVLVHHAPATPVENPDRSSTLPRVGARSKSTTQAPSGLSARRNDMDGSAHGSSRTIPRNFSTPAFPKQGSGVSEIKDNRLSGQPLQRRSGLSALAQNTRSPENDYIPSNMTNTGLVFPPINSKNSQVAEAESDAIGSRDIADYNSENNREKRKASLSKFLELRQALPTSLGISRRMSGSSDSGVTSRDTSPSASIIQRHTRKNLDNVHTEIPKHSGIPSATSAFEQRMSQPSLRQSGATSSTLPSAFITSPHPQTTNPYVLSSVAIADSNVFGAPRLFLNGANLEATDDSSREKKKSKLPKTPNETEGDNSGFVCPSPNMDTSVSSSYRSSDQGFVESESSDMDVDDIHDDNSDFSTPPEEVESFPAYDEDAETSMRFATPHVLEKLLADTQKQISQDRKATPSFSSYDPYAKSDSQFRYVPRGTRRAKSDEDNKYRPHSPRRTFRQAPSFSDGASSNRTLSESLETLKEKAPSEQVKHYPTNASFLDKKPLEEDRLSLASTSTLTSHETPGLHPFDVAVSKASDYTTSSDFQSSQDRSEQKSVPVMGMAAQHKYRRTFSPSRVRKHLISTPEEDTTGPSYALNRPSAFAPPPSNVSNVSQEPILRLSETIPNQCSAVSPILSPTCSSTPPTSKVGKKVEKQRDSQDIKAVSTKVESPVSTASPLFSTDTSKNYCDVTICSPQTVPKTSQVLPVRSASLQSEDFRKPLPTAQYVTDTSNILVKQNEIPIEEVIVKNVSRQETAPIPKANEPHAQTSLETERETEAFFPLIHGLELSSDETPTFKGDSLRDYLQGQARIMRSRSMSPRKEKSGLNVRKSPDKKKVKKMDYKNKKAGEIDELIPKQSEFEEGTIVYDSESQALSAQHGNVSNKPLVSILRREGHEKRLIVMVDKECQTSSWLISSLVKEKSGKSKKKKQSVSQLKNRRDSSASDTAVPEKLILKRRNATQWSSLGDLRKITTEKPRRSSRSPEKRLFRSKSSKSNRSKKSIEGAGIVDPLRPGGSQFQGGGDGLPKPKKLSLTAIILLKNRLAKFKERKKKERDRRMSQEEDDQTESDVPSDTLITIENELNLSKLEVSKETDIIDDNIFEPEFSLDYSKKQIRFEEMSPSEPMQSEEPLPPLPPSTSRRMRQRRESTMRERRRKCVSYCKKFIAFLFSHIGLSSLVVAYTIMGGFIFRALESGNDMDVSGLIITKRNNLIGQLIQLAVDLKDSEAGMLNLTTEVGGHIKDFQKFIYEKVKNEGWNGQEEGVWSFASSLLYAITVTTTIAFSHTQDSSESNFKGEKSLEAFQNVFYGNL